MSTKILFSGRSGGDTIACMFPPHTYTHTSLFLQNIVDTIEILQYSRKSLYKAIRGS